MTDALTGAEWLQAARALLGAAAAEDLRLVDVEAVGEPQGFVGDTQAVVVRVRNDGGGEQKAALFLKVVPKGNAAREALAEGSRAFHKESGFFGLLARLRPRLRAPLPPWGARCLLAQPRLLLFEDLGAQGFRTLEARSTLDFAHCAAALDALARLHATSIALEEADRRARHLNPHRLGDRFPDPLQEIMFTDEFPNHMSKYFLSSLKAIKAVLALMHEFKDSPRYQEILRKMDDVPQTAYKIVKTSEKHRNVICHGDLWVPNIMFRYSSWGQVAEARLVDMQLTRYAPPALDVSALLHMAARRELRETRGAELRDLYHTSLTRTLTEAGFPPSDGLLSRAAFDASWKDCAPFGAIIAACLPGDLLPPDVVRAQQGSEEDLERFLTQDRSAVIAAEFERDANYRERVGEIASDLVRMVVLRK